jgi:hypothetical protein
MAAPIEIANLILGGHAKLAREFWKGWLERMMAELVAEGHGR